MTPPLLTNAISFHLVNSGLIRVKLSVIFPETHRCRKKEGAWSWCNWGGCNSHMYSTPVNFQVVYCILEQFRPRRNFAVFYFFHSSLLYATVNTRVCQNTYFSQYHPTLEIDQNHPNLEHFKITLPQKNPFPFQKKPNTPHSSKSTGTTMGLHGQ